MWPRRDPEEEHLCFHDNASLVQEVHWPGVPARPGPVLSEATPRRPAALQHRSWTQRGSPGWGLLRALCRQDAARCSQGEHTGHSREAGGAERNELPGTPLPQGSGGSHLDGAPEHSRHVHTPLHLTHTRACTCHAMQTHERAHTRAHTHACVCTCAHGSMHTRVCTCVHAHTHREGLRGDPGQFCWGRVMQRP